MPQYLLSVLPELAVLKRLSSVSGPGDEIRIAGCMSVNGVVTVRHLSSHNAAATIALELASLQGQLEVRSVRSS
jgi:hypothetical protein